MDSDDDLFFDDIDDSMLAEVDAIESAHKSVVVPLPQPAPATAPATASRPKFKPAGVAKPPAPAPAPATNSAPPLPPPPSRAAPSLPSRTPTIVIEIPDSDDYDVSCNFADDDLAALDEVAAVAYSRSASSSSSAPALPPLTPPTSASVPFRTLPPARPPSTNAQQYDLFGEPVTGNGVASSSRNASTSNLHLNANNNNNRSSINRASSFGGPQRKVKHWNHTASSKSGRKKSAKGKGRSMDGDDAEEDEEILPASNVPSRPPPPMKLKADPLSIKHWTYPLNKPKRDYQFNIVKHSLFENTLVALPTGLGKTFIAGVVMLNFYTWFPEGKVIFVAPTKPLVSQQVVACHKVCGIPGRDAVEMTGEIPTSVREKHWTNKRVFYLTPQTLINDLEKGRVDAKDIVLLVIDEAHKGTGEYAYAQVVRFMMANNPHFRVLALTATPGGNPEAVQALVDALHISRIEIRNEDSLDLKQYLHRKIMKQHAVPMDEHVVAVRDLLVKVMEPPFQQLQRAGLLRGADPIRMHPYRPQAEMSTVRARPDGRSLGWTYGVLKKVAALARAMGYLMESSVGMCHTSLRQIADEVSEDGKKASTLTKDPNFIATMGELEKQKRQPGGFKLHPKMVELKSLIVQHFGAQMADAEPEGEQGDEDSENAPPVRPRPGQNEGRVMVFAAFREVVEEIVEVLNQEQPLIRAIKLIGQSADKQGNSGLNQKAQQKVLDRFKAGEGNVLVATSIGEEGLDIGEIDMVICYDAQKTPIRMLQRIGRTGRKSDGYVHILMAEGREEDNWNKSKEAYEAVQRAIVRAEQLELYADVPRLLPDTAKPQCIEMVMEIEEYSRQTSRNQSAVDEGAGGNDDSPQKKSTKRKRNDDVARNAPDGVAKGFQSVKEMLSGGAGAGKGKGKGKGRAKKLKPSNLDDTTDDDDREIEAGIFAPSTKKTNVADIPVSADAGAGTSSAKKRRTKKDTDDSIAGPTSKAKANKVAAPKPKKSVKRKGVIIDPPTLSQAGKTDSEDEAILNGLDPFFSAKNVRDKGKGKSPAKSPQKRGGYIEVDNGLSSNEEDLNSPPSGRKDTSKSKSASRTSRTFSPQPVFLPAEDDDTIDLVSHDRSRSASLAPVNRSRSHTRSPSPFDWDLPPDLDTFTMPPSAERVGIPSTDLHDDEEGALEPLFLPSQAPPGSALAPSRRQSFTPPPHSRSAPSIHETEDVSWLLGSDEDEDRDHSAIEIHSSPPPPSPPPPPLRARLDTPSHEVDKEEEEDVEFADTPSILNSPPSPALSVPIASPAPPPPRHRAFSAQAMPPPALLPPATHLSFESPPQPSFPIGRGVAARKRVLLHDSSPVEQSASFDSPPQPSFPVARGGAARKRVLLPDSSPLEQSVRRAPKGLQRLQRARESSPTSPLAPRPAKRTKRIRPRPDAAALRAFVEDEAGHSGAEVSEGSSGEDDPESESDLRFLRAPPETQIPEGYAQTQVYARSLATQAPGGPGPQFAARPRARGRFGPIRTPVRRARRASSPVTELGSEPDEYSFGSFIVEDEEDIVYEDDSSQLNI